MRTIYNLQVCRAIAAILVLLEHGSLMIDPKIFHGFFTIGWCGVDFFFVLSGFIIYYVNAHAIGLPAKFKKYMSKRLCRIYPIYWIYTIAAVVLFTLLYGNHYSIPYILRSLALYPFHTELGQFPIIAPAHTLTYEVIFYIIFGMGILTGRKIFTGIMLLWLGLICCNMFTPVFTGGGTIVAVILNPINIEFFYGCLIAHLVMNKPPEGNKTKAYLLLLTGLLLLLVAWITQLNNYGILLNRQYLRFGIPFALIIYAVALLENAGQQTALKKFFVALGDASYSIYLLHYVGMFLLTDFIFKKTPQLDTLLRLTISLVVLVAISYCSYKWIEHPLMKFFSKKIKQAGI